MVLLPASHIHLDQRVESHLVWVETVALHRLEQIVRSVQKLGFAAAFQQSVERDLVRLDGRVSLAAQDLLNELDSSLNLTHFDASVNEQIQNDFVLACRLLKMIPHVARLI